MTDDTPRPGITIPAYPNHIIQHANHRAATFFRDDYHTRRDDSGNTGAGPIQIRGSATGELKLQSLHSEKN
jgi:hypothetical protein